MKLTLAHPRFLVRCLVAVAAGATLMTPARVAAQTPPPPAARERILVVPFDNITKEARFYWLREGAAVLVVRNLEALGVAAVSREQRLKAFERLQLPPNASLSEATIIRVGQLIGAAQVVTGRFTIENGRVTVRARSTRLDTGRMRPEVVESGPLEELFAVCERVARGLMPPGLLQAGDLGVDHGSLAVFENYTKGLLAETSSAQVKFLDAALKAAPDNGPVRVALWQAYAAQGDHARAAQIAQAAKASSPMRRRLRFLLALSRIQLKQYEDAFQILKALLEDASTPAILNNMGIIQLRRGATPQTGRATYFFNKAAEADKDDPDYDFNLAYAYWFERDYQAALYWLKEAVRRNPADGDAHFILGAVLTATGANVEGQRERELARRLSSVYGEWERRPNAATEPVPRGLERLRDDLDASRLTLVEATLASVEQKDTQAVARYHLERGQRLFAQQQDRDAADEVNRSLYLLPYQAEAHLLRGRLYLRMGRTREAIEALTISLWCQESAAAHAVLGEVYLHAKNLQGARNELDKATALEPSSADVKALAEKLRELAKKPV